MISASPSLPAYTVFETGIGPIGLAWSAAGVVRLHLPEASVEATRWRLLSSLQGAVAADPPPAIAALVEKLKRYGTGTPTDFTDIALDLAGVDPFRLAICRAARALGFGETVTYGELSARAGHAGMARETGQALGRNPVAIIIPCHRVLAAGGRIGGFSARGGARTKARLLAIEGARAGPPPPAQASFAF